MIRVSNWGMGSAPAHPAPMRHVSKPAESGLRRIVVATSQREYASAQREREREREYESLGLAAV